MDEESESDVITNMQFNTPILFMIFNRPEYTRRVFDAIRQAKPTHLYVVTDGPRSDEERPICEKTRAIIDTIDWPCTVHKNYTEKNMGLKDRPSSGITWFFEQVEYGIILEDDCLPHLSFFRFASELLEKYKSDERVMMVSGSNFIPSLEIPCSYFFSKFFSIWGWATWRRAWGKYDIEMRGWDTDKKELLKSIYPEIPSYVQKNIAKMFNEVRSGRHRTWDTQWFYSCLASDGVCIAPKTNLISNIGIDGTHTAGGDNQNIPTYDIYENGPLRHPPSGEQYIEYDRIFYEKNYPKERFSVGGTIVPFLARFGPLKRLYRFIFR